MAQESPPICRSCRNWTPYRFRYATDGLLRLGWRCSKGITTRAVRDDCSSYRRGAPPPSILPGGNLEWRQPELDRLERMLVGVFLRRYVTWCVRSRRDDRIAGALSDAKRNGLALNLIQDGAGHASVTTTEGYLRGFDVKRVNLGLSLPRVSKSGT